MRAAAESRDGSKAGCTLAPSARRVQRRAAARGGREHAFPLEFTLQRQSSAEWPTGCEATCFGTPVSSPVSSHHCNTRRRPAGVANR